MSTLSIPSVAATKADSVSSSSDSALDGLSVTSTITQFLREEEGEEKQKNDPILERIINIETGSIREHEPEPQEDEQNVEDQDEDDNRTVFYSVTSMGQNKESDGNSLPMTAQLKQLQRERSAMNAYVGRLVLDNQNLMEKLTQAEEEAVRSKSEVIKVKDEAVNIQGKYLAMKKKLILERQEDKKVLVNARRNLTELKVFYDQREEEVIKEKKQEMENWKEKVEVRDKEIVDLHQQLDNKHKEVENLKKKLEKLKLLFIQNEADEEY